MYSKPSIYFLCPDIDIPSGGINRIYRLAKVTQDAGYPACVLHEREGFFNHWAPAFPTFHYWKNGLQLKRDDVVVIPESEPGAMRRLPDGIRKVALALDWSYIFENLPEDDRWVDYGICQVLTASGIIKEFISWTMNLPIHRISPAVDHALFHYDPSLKQPSIVYMAHRNAHGVWVDKIFRQLPRPIPERHWVPVKGMTVAEYAAVLRRAEIFVSTGLREGVPGPILEAMASGAIVVGYGGVGGNEYLVPHGTKQNAFQVENDDYFALCRVLEKVIFMIENQDPLIEKIRGNALDIVKTLTYDAEKESLIRFWDSFI